MLLGFTLLVTGASLLLFVVVFLGRRLVLARYLAYLAAGVARLP